ncbi:hypothetical protein ACFYRD_08725 [Streptomyces hirsutus]|uniref:hypothetical protein n=1 Tax=Streptomyces hirsutus TaxID=35620 RepID=UPI00369A1D28
MAWRDRLRRRAAADRSDVPGDDPSGAGPDRGAPGAPGPSVPGDWDGGWRRTAAPELTVSRAPLGVSDGLAFRAGLAAWQNPSFDSGLGHALLPAAPTGLVRGVTRTAAPQPTHTAGGPLLLRALRLEGADASGDGASDGATAGRTPEIARRKDPGERKSGSTESGSGSSAVRPSGIGTGGDNPAGRVSSSDDAPRSRGLTLTDSPTVLSSSPAAVQRAVESPVVVPADTGRQPVVPRTPLVRRVAVVPPAAADGAAPRPASGANPGRTSGTRTDSGGRTPSGPAVRRAANETTGTRSARSGAEESRPAVRRAATEATGPRPEASRTSGADGSRPAVRLSPSGPRLTVARRPAGPVRRVAAVRPVNPPVPGTAPTPDASGTTTPASTSVGSSAPVQRAATAPHRRAPLGAPLSELPSTATPLTQDTLAPGAGTPPGPTLPVVQRQADTSGPYDSGTSATKETAPAAPADAPRRTSAPGSTGARARGGLGAPLPALPPSAELPGSAASRASRTAPGPDVQRAPVRPGQSSATAPVPPTGAAPPAPGADAPLLGTADVQRSLVDHSTGGATRATPADHGNGPATPLVTPSPAVAPNRPEPAHTGATEGAAGKARRPGAAPGGASADGPGSGGSRADGSASGGPRADGPGSGGPRADGPGSDRQRPQRAVVPGPVVVARAVVPDTESTRPAGSAGQLRPTVTSSAAHSATAAPRTLSLLAARPLTLSTRTPEGAAPPAAARSGSRPVVAARWPGAPSAAPADTTPPTGAPARRFGTSAGSSGGSGAAMRPLPGPSAPARATPQLQRAAPAHPGPRGKHVGVRTTASPDPVQRVPVVRPAPPRPLTADATTAVPAKPLPVTAPQAPPLADHPSAATAPVGPVPVVRPRTVAPGAGPAAGSATPVQRDVTDSVGVDLLKGVQAKEAPARGRSRSSSVSSGSSASPAFPASPSASGKAAARRPDTPRDDPGLDLDDLARRLLDPVSRLLRTELRRGRDRTGRPYDGRR